MKGRKSTELVQSTKDRQKTSKNKAMLYSESPICEVLYQNGTSKMELRVPIPSKAKMIQNTGILPLVANLQRPMVIGPMLANWTIIDKYEARVHFSGSLSTSKGNSTHKPFILIQELMPNKMAKMSTKIFLDLLLKINMATVCHWVLSMRIFLPFKIYVTSIWANWETDKLPFWFLTI